MASYLHLFLTGKKTNKSDICRIFEGTQGNLLLSLYPACAQTLTQAQCHTESYAGLLDFAPPLKHCFFSLGTTSPCELTHRSVTTHNLVQTRQIFPSHSDALVRPHNVLHASQSDDSKHWKKETWNLAEPPSEILSANKSDQILRGMRSAASFWCPCEPTQSVLFTQT